MKKSQKPRTYDDEILSVLVFEFAHSDRADSERKIKRRLREKGLGTFDQTRVDAIRAFKDDVQDELSLGPQSQYYAGSHGEYASLADWDIAGLMSHMKNTHPDVEGNTVEGYLTYMIYLYYLR